MKRLTVLLAAAVCTAGIGAASALLLRPSEEPKPQYILRDNGGKLALYENGEAEPRIKYEIYTQLLPPDDTEKLRYGILVESPEELHRLLEDLGI